MYRCLWLRRPSSRLTVVSARHGLFSGNVGVGGSTASTVPNLVALVHELLQGGFREKQSILEPGFCFAFPQKC